MKAGYRDLDVASHQYEEYRHQPSRLTAFVMLM
jgi:hypothetical protein